MDVIPNSTDTLPAGFGKRLLGFVADSLAAYGRIAWLDGDIAAPRELVPQWAPEAAALPCVPPGTSRC